MATETTIRIPAEKYGHSDHCLTDAAQDYAEAHGLQGWDLSPRWESDQRETILLSVPSNHEHCCEVCGEHVEEFCAAHPRASVVSVKIS